MVTIDDVITNCLLAYHLSGNRPSALRSAAIRMQAMYVLDNDSCKLLETLATSLAPQLHLNAAVAKLNYIRDIPQ